VTSTRFTIFETITACRVCSYLMIHQDIHVSTALTAQSVTFNFSSIYSVGITGER